MQLMFGTAVCLLITMCSAQAQSGAAAQQTPVANAQFEKMKTLVGDWEYNGSDGERIVDTFRIFGEGSAILHLEKAEGRQDVITIFYPVGAELRGDHYCFLKNQPRFVASPSSDPNVITFKFRDITNLSASPEKTHMHSTTWRFVDADHLTQEWHLWANGKETQVFRLDFVRVK